MTMFIITIDTEPDNEWARPTVHTTENARFVPRFHEFCASYGFKVTYLVTLEMARSEVLQQYLVPRLEAGECEVGAHLHPWNTPPDVQITKDDSCFQPFPCEYPPELQREKLETLVAAIEQGYGRRPVSYKAGRWGLDEVHAGILDDMGFRADTSVCPGVDWRRTKGNPDGTGGPDFTRASPLPYRLSREDVCLAGDSGILEVSPTIVFSNLSEMLNRFFPVLRRTYWLNRRFRRQIDRLRLGMQWLRPYPRMSLGQLIDVARLARRRGVPVLNLTFHSSEMMPGGSPYNRTEEAIEYLYERLGGLFSFLNDEGMEGMTLSEVRDRLEA